MGLSATELQPHAPLAERLYTWNIAGRPFEGNSGIGMKKAANRKPKHNARRAKARSPVAHAHGPSKPAKFATQFSHANSGPGLLGRLVSNRNHFAAPLGNGAKSARSAIAWLQRAPQACIRAIPLPAEDREMVALLLAPFFILALAIAGNQSIQLTKHLKALIARPVAPVMLPTGNPNAHEIALRRDTGIEKQVRLTALQPQVAAKRIIEPNHSAAYRTAPDQTAQTLPPPAALPRSDITVGFEPVMTAAVRPIFLGIPRENLAHKTALQPPDRLTPQATPSLLANTTPEWQPAPAHQESRQTFTALGPQAVDGLVAFEEDRDIATRRVSLFERCSLPGTGTQPASTAATNTLANVSTPIAPASWFTPPGMPTFGQRLAAAARRQLGEFVIYNDAYRSIAYPRGDVAKLYGVCTDVVIRAYRDLGIDLQVAVQNARVGSGDRNIDHRRTETLRRFFQRAGESLPVTSFAEDYLPGDIVTYARPQNTGTASRSHIAVVSDVIAPSGRPMIVHNRGWGPQLEDALFVDRITGHYRYAGAARSTPIGEAVTSPQQRAAGADGRSTAEPRTRNTPRNSRRTASANRTVR